MNIVIIKGESQAPPFTFSPHPHNPPLSAARSRRSSTAPRLPLPVASVNPAAPCPSSTPRRSTRPAPVDVCTPHRTVDGRTEGARASAGRSVGRAAPPRSASMRTAWPGRAVRDALGPAPNHHQPAREPRQTPAAASTRPHARSTGGAAAHMAAHHPPIGAQVRPDRPSPCPAQPTSPTARPAVSPPSPRHRPAPVGSGTPGTHPAHPRSVPAVPLRARTLSRACDRRVSDLGSGSDFGIEIGLGGLRTLSARPMPLGGP